MALTVNMIICVYGSILKFSILCCQSFKHALVYNIFNKRGEN